MMGANRLKSEDHNPGDSVVSSRMCLSSALQLSQCLMYDMPSLSSLSTTSLCAGRSASATRNLAQSRAIARLAWIRFHAGDGLC
jgi:hypothetical protein